MDTWENIQAAESLTCDLQDSKLSQPYKSGKSECLILYKKEALEVGFLNKVQFKMKNLIPRDSTKDLEFNIHKKYFKNITVV